MERENRIAVLIDGDNAQATLVQEILSEVSKHGKITTRRIYGDFTTGMTQWKKVLNENAITPQQQFAYSYGKNSTDSFMIIDAMDLLHSNKVDGFAIVSSDSDFTRLATRIREEGLFVMGIGRRNSTQAFVNACEVFVYTEIIGDEDLDIAPDVEDAHPSPEVDETETIVDYSGMTVVELKELLRNSGMKVSGNKPELIARLETPRLAPEASLIMRAIDLCTLDEEGWVNLATIGIFLRKLDPAFDSRSYGHRSLSLLIKSIPIFEYRSEGTAAAVRIAPGNN